MQNIEILKKYYEILDELCKSEFILELLNGPETEIIDIPGAYATRYLRERNLLNTPECDEALRNLTKTAAALNAFWPERKIQIISWREFVMNLCKQRDMLKCVLSFDSIKTECENLAQKYSIDSIKEGEDNGIS